MVDLINPPQGMIDPGSERNALACVIKSNEAWLKLPANFGSEEFEVPLNKALWIVIDSLYSKGAAIDPVVVHEALPVQFQEELRDLGGWNYIQTLHDLPIDPNNITYESGKLLELSMSRRMFHAGARIVDLSSKEKPISKKREEIEVILGEIDKSNDELVENIAVNGYEFIDKKMANPVEIPGIPSGFDEVDRAIQGFQPGRLYVVGARKKTGKSMILLNWAKYISVDLGIPILWISTEHTIDDEYSRLLSHTSGVYEMAINNGTFSKVELHMQKVADANEKLSKSPFHFVSMPFFSLDKIKRLTRKMVRVHGVQIVFFDFIKTPEGDNHLKEWQELGNFTYGLKALAIAEGVPIVSAVQINREGQQNFRLDGEIDSDSFAGSDRIAQALSVAFILRKPNQQEANGDSDSFRVLRIADNRHGAASLKMLLNFRGETITMSENKRL